MNILLLILILLGEPAFAVTLDAQSMNEKVGGTTLTQAHTVTAGGGNRILVVMCSLRSTSVTLTATYAGQNMTATAGSPYLGTGLENYIFYIVNPALGTNDWVVTQSSALAMICNAYSATNVDQVTPLGDEDNVCSSGTSSTRTLTANDSDLIIDINSLNIESAALTAGADQTVGSGLPFESSGTTLTHSSSRQAGTVDDIMSWSWTGAAQYCLSAVTLSNSTYVSSSRHVGPMVFK